MVSRGYAAKCRHTLTIQVFCLFIQTVIVPVSYTHLAYLQKKNPAAILPIQIAYYAGLRIGEACGLAWQDVNLEEQCLTIRRSIRYDGSKRKYIIGPTKRKKVRIVYFGDTLVEIFRNARNCLLYTSSVRLAVRWNPFLVLLLRKKTSQS